MAQGPGKYDDLATLVRKRAGAAGVVLVVIGGGRGSGITLQITNDPRLKEPLLRLLRELADEIQRDLTAAN